MYGPGPASDTIRSGFPGHILELCPLLGAGQWALLPPVALNDTCRSGLDIPDPLPQDSEKVPSLHSVEESGGRPDWPPATFAIQL